MAGGGGLNPHATGGGGGWPKKTAGIRAQRGQRLVSGHYRRGTSARATGDSFRIPRIGARAKCRIFGGRSHGKFIHVGSSERDSAGCSQPFDNGGVVRGDISLQNLRGAPTRVAFYANDILDRDGNASQRKGDVCLFRLFQSTLRIKR